MPHRIYDPNAETKRRHDPSWSEYDSYVPIGLFLLFLLTIILFFGCYFHQSNQQMKKESEAAGT